MSRLARCCLPLALLGHASVGDTRTPHAADDRSPILRRIIVRAEPDGFVLVAINKRPPRPAVRPASVTLGRGLRIDRALFERPCHTERGGGDAAAC